MRRSQLAQAGQAAHLVNRDVPPPNARARVTAFRFAAAVGAFTLGLAHRATALAACRPSV